jgi:type IV pilus assembly protein PilA
MNLAAAAKAAVAESFLNRGTAPANRTVAGMSGLGTDTRGKYVTGVDVTNGTIIVTYGGTEANAQINGATLEIVPYVTPDRSVAWRCGGAGVPNGTTIMNGAAYTGGTLAGATLVKYLPSACRP